MTGLLSLFLYSLLPISSFLDLVAMALNKGADHLSRIKNPTEGPGLPWVQDEP